ncbi:hypothetical protein Syun_013476 [Stephania yunnanensis]|uniref:RRM domain-containing protein n=1 Tax=Stephania yunnanensis TaxID=152371 RepID=A0AAP0JIN7_9MAGN
MPGNRASTVYVGNLDEKVSDRVLYEILIQAGRIVDLHVPRDRETNRPKGYAFAEYETEEIANYAVRLFSGLVILFNKTLKFAISGQDRPSSNLSGSVSSHLNPSSKPRSYDDRDRFSDYSLNHGQGSASTGNVHRNGYSSDLNGNNYSYSRRVFGTALDGFSRANSNRNMHDFKTPGSHSSY